MLLCALQIKTIIVVVVTTRVPSLDSYENFLTFVKRPDCFVIVFLPAFTVSAC